MSSEKLISVVVVGSVRSLPGEWRARAEELSVDDAIGLTHQLKLKDCANELEAALESMPTSPAMGVTVAMVHAFEDAYCKNWEAQRRAPEGTKELGTFFATRAGLEAALSAQPSPGGQGDADPDVVALDVARRFTPDGEPQRRARLQVAIVTAIAAANAEHIPVGYTLLDDIDLCRLRERAELPMRIEKGELWHWQGDGHDFPESLACPVVMTADTLRALIASRQPVGEPFAYTRATTAVVPALPIITPDEYDGLRAQGHGKGFRALVFADAATAAPDLQQDDACNEAFGEFADDYLTDGNGYAPGTTYAACSKAFTAAWPDRVAATAAARAELKRLHGDDRTVGARRAEALNRADARDDAEDDAAAPAQAVEMSPDFTDTARAAIAWVLWHHQGGSSPVGQPLRFALGMGQHDRMTDHQIAEAKRFAAWANATTEDFHHRAPAQNVDLAPDHRGMRVDYHGLLGRSQEALRQRPELAEMLRQLHGHLTEMGKRWYAGDRKVVDEFLQLYGIEDGGRRALISSGNAVGSTATWSVLQIGNEGAFYDPKGALRAFTYAKQPGNDLAARLGYATNEAYRASAGDSIDRGLSLLKSLQDYGFGVFQTGEKVGQ